MAKKNEVAKNEQAAAPALFDPSKFRKVADVVLKTISIKNMEEGDELYFRAESEIRYVEQVDEKTGEVKQDKKGENALLPLIIAERLDTGERGQMVLPAIVLRGLLQCGEITGRMFAMKKGKSLGVGKANIWDVVEIAEAE